MTQEHASGEAAMNGKTVVVLGASDKPDKFSNKAFTLLRKHGYRVIPVNPGLSSLDGVPVLSALSDIRESVDTLTVYLAPERSLPLTDLMVGLKRKRVLLNPGTESESLEKRLAEAGIPVLKNCTLVLLNSGRF